MDPISATLSTFGVILIAGSWILLLITSFKEDFSWGLTTLFLPPLSYIYGFFSLDKSKDALVMAGGGWGLILLALMA